MLKRLGFAVTVALLVSTPCTPALSDERPQGALIAFELISDDLEHPVQIAPLPGDPTSLAIAERSGLVLRFSKQDKTTEEIIDIENLINAKQPRGLLGFAFNPAKTGELFINYLDSQGDLVVGRFPQPGKETLDESSMSVAIKVAHISRNDHGSQIAFSGDDILLITTGDGHAPSDANTQSAQSKTTLLGKVLRLNTRNSTRYEIPKNNPFAGQLPMLGEIWALGFQNPDQLSLDPQSGAIFVVDNSNAVLEINFVERGQNYGWNILEGTSCRKTPCSNQGFSPPAISIPRKNQNSRLVAGGIYRGAKISSLTGKFIFAESESGSIYAAFETSLKIWTFKEIAKLSGKTISALGQDPEGEVYVATDQGSLFRLKPASL